MNDFIITSTPQGTWTRYRCVPPDGSTYTASDKRTMVSQLYRRYGIKSTQIRFVETETDAEAELVLAIAGARIIEKETAA